MSLHLVTTAINSTERSSLRNRSRIPLDDSLKISCHDAKGGPCNTNYSPPCTLLKGTIETTENYIVCEVE